MVPGSRNAGLTFSRPPVEPGVGDSQAVERETPGKTSFSGFSLRLHAAEQQIPVKKGIFWLWSLWPALWNSLPVVPT